MITIQGFAKLCNCSTQTLRYYDRIGLLLPAKVDAWTGYRYYEENQAMQFVKIKNLQQADFSIAEIQSLLKEDGSRLQEAFERKITEQEQKLNRIKKIQQTYLDQAMEMQNTICLLADFVEGKAGNPKLWEEFGLDVSRQTQVHAKAHEILADWLAEVRNASKEIAQQLDSQNTETMKTVMDALSSGHGSEKNLLDSVTEQSSEAGSALPADAEKLYECSGWTHVSEWIDQLPGLERGKQSFFQFQVREDSPVYDPGFPIIMLSVLASKYDVMQDGVSCNVERSDDGQNHVVLLRK